MIEAIVYTSNTGYTAQYAKLLGEKIGLPVFSLDAANGQISSGTEILYLGWIMASKIKGYQNAAKQYQIQAVCGVGMGGTGTQMTQVRKRNAIPDDLPVFTLQGGFDITKLHGMHKLMMTMMVKIMGKNLASKNDRSPDEDAMLAMMLHGGSHVCAENLQAVLAWYEHSGTVR